MFDEAISELTLTSVTANNVMSRISANSFNGDFTLTATLRALLWSRSEDTIGAAFDSVNVMGNGASARSRVDRLVDKDVSLIFANVCGRDTDTENFFNWLKGYLGATSWRRLEKVEVFFKTINVVCFVNEELKRTILFVRSLTVQKLHLLQAGVLAYMPWYFDKERGITTEERDLIESLREKRPDKYIDSIERIAATINLRALLVEKLAGFEGEYERERVGVLKRKLNSAYADIRAYQASINSLIEECTGYDTELNAIEQKIASGSGNNELMNYIGRNQSIIVEDVGSRDVTFVVKTQLAYFDESIAERFIDNRNSYMYYCDEDDDFEQSDISHDQMHELLKAIFIDQTIKVNMCAAYRLSTRGTVDGLSNYRFGAALRDCIPNPHINFFSCLGGYRDAITSCVTESRDFVAAVEQCCASARSVTLTESIVMRYLVRYLYGLDAKDSKFCVLPDGTNCTSLEAVKWLELQESQG